MENANMMEENGAVRHPRGHKKERTQIMTTKEISKYLGVHEMTVYRWLKKGVIPGFKIGGRWRSKKDLLDSYLVQRMQAK